MGLLKNNPQVEETSAKSALGEMVKGIMHKILQNIESIKSEKNLANLAMRGKLNYKFKNKLFTAVSNHFV